MPSSHQPFKTNPNPLPLLDLLQGSRPMGGKKTSEKGLTTEWTSGFVARCKPFVLKKKRFHRLKNILKLPFYINIWSKLKMIKWKRILKFCSLHSAPESTQCSAPSTIPSSLSFPHQPLRPTGKTSCET